MMHRARIFDCSRPYSRFGRGIARLDDLNFGRGVAIFVGLGGIRQNHHPHLKQDTGRDFESESVKKSRFGNTETPWRGSNARAVTDGASGPRRGDGSRRQSF